MRKESRRRFDKTSSNRIGLWSGLVITLLLIGYAGVLLYARPNVEGERLRLDEFVNLVREGRVDNAVVLDGDSVIIGRYERDDGSTGRYNAAYLRTLANQERLLTVLLDEEVPTRIDQQYEKRLVLPATLLLPALILVVIFIYLIVSHRRGTGLFSVRSGARRTEGGDSDVTFADVAGQDEAVTEMKEISMFLSDPERFTSVGAQIPKGILVYGPPGCGKTLVARALAGEAGAAFFSISGSDFVELYVGVGASRVRELFKEARANAPAIIFIDELDSVGRRRGSTTSMGSREEQEQALNQILAEMDGFSPMEGIVVVGATNRPDVLDPALLRPGRFDRAIGLQRTGEADRLAILRLHARGKALAPGADLAAIAERAIGMTGADLASVMNEAALLAARSGRPSLGQQELDEALVRVLEAPEKQRRLAMRDRSLGHQTLSGERVTFSDVAGLEEAIVELAEVRDYLGDPDRFAALGARTPRGFLLVGPPGCGKTLLARAVAHETNAAFFSVGASEFTELFVGEGAARVRDLFAQARAVQPSILFIDEIDAIGAHRGAGTDGHREREQTLNQILIELDGFGQSDGVMVMAATNRPEMLDAALVRPGRFDRTITIGLPDRAGRRGILAVHSKNKPLAEDTDLGAIAGLTRGFSGADLANVMNEAALLAARRGGHAIDRHSIEEAIERVARGVARAHILSDDERRLVAYHEAGHALVARALPGARLPHKVSIMARGMALGATWQIDTMDRLVHSRSQLIDQMAVMLGGRVAEDLVFGEPGSAGADDLGRVGRTARWMVCDLGMSEALGAISYTGDALNGHHAGVSEETARTIDAEVRRLVAEAYERAGSVLRPARRALDAVARSLMQRETLTAQDLGHVAAELS